MTGDKEIDLRMEALELRLADTRKEADYYRRRAEDTGRKGIREIDQLQSNVDERRKFEERMTYLLDLGPDCERNIH